MLDHFQDVIDDGEKITGHQVLHWTVSLSKYPSDIAPFDIVIGIKIFLRVQDMESMLKVSPSRLKEILGYDR